MIIVDIFPIIGGGAIAEGKLFSTDDRRPDLSSVPNATGYEMEADYGTHGLYTVTVYEADSGN